MTPLMTSASLANLFLNDPLLKMIAYISLRSGINSQNVLLPNVGTAYLVAVRGRVAKLFISIMKG